MGAASRVAVFPRPGSLAGGWLGDGSEAGGVGVEAGGDGVEAGDCG